MTRMSCLRPPFSIERKSIDSNSRGWLVVMVCMGALWTGAPRFTQRVQDLMAFSMSRAIKGQKKRRRACWSAPSALMWYKSSCTPCIACRREALGITSWNFTLLSSTTLRYKTPWRSSSLGRSRIRTLSSLLLVLEGKSFLPSSVWITRRKLASAICRVRHCWGFVLLVFVVTGSKMLSGILFGSFVRNSAAGI